MRANKNPVAGGDDPTTKHRDLESQAAEGSARRSTIETGGELLSDGKIIELIKDVESGPLQLLVFDGKHQTVAASVEVDGRLYVPANVSSSFISMVPLPVNAMPYESTEKLFGAIQECFTTNGVPVEVALPSTYFIFATWFTDQLPAAPCLVINGPRSEASLVLRLLSCLVRHPLCLIGINGRSFSSIPMILQPTLLIGNELGASMMKLLIASNSRDARLTTASGGVNAYSAKAIYRGRGIDDLFLGDGVLQINQLPSRGKLPLLGVRAEVMIKKQFQPQLLMYRIANISKVRDSEFDLPHFISGIRILARILGAPIVDAPKIQAGLRSVLQSQEERYRMGQWLDPKCIAIESLLADSHRVIGERLYIGGLATTATTIFRGRGEKLELEPKVMGSMLRSAFGIFPKRDSKGFAIRMTDQIRRKIHELARDFGVAPENPVKDCQYCTEILSIGGRGSDKQL
jgi:hypothetical protein